MSPPRQAWALVLAAAVLIAAALAVWKLSHPPAPKQLDPVRAGYILLNTTLPGFDDRGVALNQWRGQVVVVNFWATWCEPCRDEIPMFTKLQTQYLGKGVQFVGISVNAAEQQAEVMQFAQDAKMNYPVLLGGVEAMSLAHDAGDTQEAVPYTVVIDRSGRAAVAFIGGIEEDRLAAVLPTLLR